MVVKGMFKNFLTNGRLSAATFLVFFPAASGTGRIAPDFSAGSRLRFFLHGFATT